MSAEKRAVAQRLAADLLERLRPIIDLGLGYLSLDRSTPTLSSGELQRMRLATQLSSRGGGGGAGEEGGGSVVVSTDRGEAGWGGGGASGSERGEAKVRAEGE